MDAAIEIMEHQVDESIKTEFVDDDGDFIFGKFVTAIEIIKGIKSDAMMAD